MSRRPSATNIHHDLLTLLLEPPESVLRPRTSTESYRQELWINRLKAGCRPHRAPSVEPLRDKWIPVIKGSTEAELIIVGGVGCLNTTCVHTDYLDHSGFRMIFVLEPGAKYWRWWHRTDTELSLKLQLNTSRVVNLLPHSHSLKNTARRFVVWLQLISGVNKQTGQWSESCGSDSLYWTRPQRNSLKTAKLQLLPYQLCGLRFEPTSTFF